MSHFTSWQSYSEFAHAVRWNRRYICTPEMERFLDGVRNTVVIRVRRVPKGWRFWRAQLGCSEKEVVHEGRTFCMPTPFKRSRMMPLPGRGREGRVNAKSIPCLYGATSRLTAMAEVRPWIGAFVSVALFETTKDTRVVDCSKFHDRDPLAPLFERPIEHIPSPEEVEEDVWAQIDNAFSGPVTDSDDLADYAPTQMLAELFKSEGYGGIAYKSRLTEDGYNVAFFDLDIARMRKALLYQVTSVQFTVSENPVDEYFVGDDSGGATMRAMETNAMPIEPEACKETKRC